MKPKDQLKPEVKKNDETAGEKNTEKGEEAKKDNKEKVENIVRLRCRNTTRKPHYYRAGLCFSESFSDYELTEEMTALLEADTWLTVERIKAEE